MLHSREKRLAEMIKQSLIILFQGEMEDPRVPDIVTINHVEMRKDLKHAKVYYTTSPDDRRTMNEMEELLEDAAGFIRSYVTEDINMKFSPTLAFQYDHSAERIERIDSILEDIKKKEQASESE